jgi:Na+-driven multidrug efflux pump
MTSVNKVVKNTWILYARMAVTVFISLYATRLTLASLGATDFGLFNLVGGVIAMLTFLNTAMTAATQRFMSFAEGAGDQQKQKEIFNVSTVLHIIIAVLIFLLLEAIGVFLFERVLTIPFNRIEAAKLIYQFMIVSTVFTIVSVPYDAVINAHENMLFFAILSIIESILKLMIVLFLSYSSYDKLSTFGFLTAILSILLLFVRRIYCGENYPECSINIKKYFDKITFYELTSFAGWSFLGASSSMLANYGQGVVLNMFFGPLVNASQAISGQVSGQLGAFALNMLKALNPLIAKSAGAGNKELMINASIIGSKVSFFLLMFFYIPVLLEMPYIFKLWLTNVPSYAIIFCRLLLLRNFIEQLYIPISTTIAADGNIKKYQMYSSILNFFPLIISYLLFRVGFDSTYLYIAFIVYSLLAFILTLYFSNKNFQFPIMSFMRDTVLRTLTVLLLVSLFAYIPLYLFKEGVPRLLLVGSISTGMAILFIWIIGLTAKEQSSIKNVISDKYSF